jgi:hypothetical protein
MSNRFASAASVATLSAALALAGCASSSGGPSRCMLRTGPAQTADKGIRWATFRV